MCIRDRFFGIVFGGKAALFMGIDSAVLIFAYDVPVSYTHLSRAPPGVKLFQAFHTGDHAVLEGVLKLAVLNA